MFLRKILFLTFLILYEILTFGNSQEYIHELYPKDIKLNINDELPPVEIPRPILSQRLARSYDIDIGDSLEDESRRQKSQRPTLMDIALEASVREGLNAMKQLYSVVEPDMVKNGHVLQDNHPAALLSKFSAPVVESTRREMAAYATLTAAKAFRKNYEVSNDWARQAHTQRVSLRRTALESLCSPRDPPTCMPASDRYRTHDGTCNNKRRLRWGAAQMPFNRFLPPEYGDGVDSTRSSVDGGPLSSSRFVSLLVHGARDGEASLTLMLAQWGQLLDHDLTSTAQPRSINGSVPSCCGNKDFHPSCFPIKVPLDDPWLSPLKVRCLEFLRSAPAQRRDCVLSWREQTNQATSYIDASPIYSSSVKSSDNARVFRNGLLIFGRGNPADDVCQRGAIATHCIRSGDGRSGEQPGLLALHHVWVHEHNYIAMKLSEMNLHWSDEKIYQETRRIIGAMFQHITYREFLPIVLGREVVKLFDLELLSSGYYEGYDPKTNPTVANAFAAAAFRFGHSLVQNSYLRCDRFHNVMNNNVSLHEEFQRGDIGSVGSLHRLIRGMASQRALKRDEFITPELTNHLFQTPGFPFGLDLAAINIQRGRDHGVPPYTHWRVPCGLTPITTWEEFANVVGPESARRISHAYHSVHDIDLFVGGIAERPVVGGLVGPTFACIIAQQFSNSRKGDRFWYENAGFESSFTPAQLHVIRRVSLASVLCRAVGGGTFQPHIFLPNEFPSNERLPCGVAPLGDFDISPWLEQDPFGPLTARPVQQPPPPTFKPQPVPDRIFDIMELETKSPVTADTPISDNKVGFSNRIPQIETNIKKTPAHVEFVSNSGFQRVKNTTRINDKLDIKQKGTHGHVTKQKPIPHVNSKLDKNNRKGVNRHGLIHTTTRRTIIVNNIPIELRTAAGLDQKISTKTMNTETETPLEPRIGDSELTTELSTDKEEIELKANTIMDTTTDNTGLQEVNTTKTTKPSQKETEKTADNTLNIEGRVDDLKEHLEETNTSKLAEIHLKLQPEQIDDLNKQTIKISRHTVTGNDSNLSEVQTVQTTETIDNLEGRTDDIELDVQSNNNLNDLTSKERLEIQINNRDDSTTFSKLDSAHTETHLKAETKDHYLTVPNLRETGNSELSTLKLKNETLTLPKGNKDQNSLLTSRPVNISLHTTNDSDIDPMMHTTPFHHKRVQRKIISIEHLPIHFEGIENIDGIKNSRLKDVSDLDSTMDSKSLEHKREQLQLTSSERSQKILTDLKLTGTTLTEHDLKRNQGHYTDSDIDPLIHLSSSDQKQEHSKLTPPETTQQLTTNVKIKETTLTEIDLKRNDVHTADSHIDSPRTVTESDLKEKVDHWNEPSPKSTLGSLHLLDHKLIQYKLTSPVAMEQLLTVDKLTETTQIKSDLKRNDDLKTDSETEYKQIQRKFTPTTKNLKTTLTKTDLESIDGHKNYIKVEQKKCALTPPTTQQLPTSEKLTEAILTERDLKINDKTAAKIDQKQVQRELTPPTTMDQLSKNIKLTKTTQTESDLNGYDVYKTDADIEQNRIQRKLTSSATTKLLSTNNKLTEKTLTETDLERNDDHNNDIKINQTQGHHTLTSPATTQELLTNAQQTETILTEPNIKKNNIHKTHSEIEQIQRKLTPTATLEHISTNQKKDLKRNDIYKTESDIEHKRLQRTLTPRNKIEKISTNDRLTPLTKTDLERNDDHNKDIKFENTQGQRTLAPPTTMIQLSTHDKLTGTILTETNFKGNYIPKTDSEIEHKQLHQKLIPSTTIDKISPNDRLTKSSLAKNYVNGNDVDYKLLQRTLIPPTIMEQLGTNDKLMKTSQTETYRKRSNIQKTDFEIEQLSTNDKHTESSLTETNLNENDMHKTDSHIDSMMNMTTLRLQRIFTAPTTTEKLPKNEKLRETIDTDLRENYFHNTDSPNEALIYLTPLEEKRVQGKLTFQSTMETLSTNVKTTEGTLTETSTKTNLETKNDHTTDSQIDSVIDLVPLDYQRLQRPVSASTTTEQFSTNVKLKETTLTKTDLKRNYVHKTASQNDSLIYLTNLEHKQVQSRLTSMPAKEPLSTNVVTTESTLTETPKETILDIKVDNKNYSNNDSPIDLTSLKHKRVKRKLTLPSTMEKKTTLTETDLKGTNDDKTDSDIDPMIHSTPSEHKRVQRKLTLPTTDNLQLSRNKKLRETTLIENDLKEYSDHMNDSVIDAMVRSIPLAHKSVQRKLTLPTITKQLSSNIKQKQTTFTETYLKETNDHKNDSDVDPKVHSIPSTNKSAQRKLTIPTTTKQLSGNIQLKETTLTETDRKEINGHTTDSDIDPMVHSILLAHKSPQRKLTFPVTTEQLKDKTKFLALNNIVKSNNSLITTNRTLTTKSPRPNRTTLRHVELRQYQNRPSFTKPPQKVIVDSLNGDNQYEIEINIRQTNKSPKPLQSTPYVGDYTNGYKTNQYQRYTPSYQSYPTTTTTPLYAYYQPIPTQISSLTQNHRTKPPTIIFLDDHEQYRTTTTRQPGFLHSIVSWNSPNKRPLPQSINGEVNDRPGYEDVISSPLSTAFVAPAYQNLRPPSQNTAPGSLSSFSQAQLGGGIVQASSSAVSNGNYGSIAGFASANGADSTFSFNIRPKPDKNHITRPESLGGIGAGSYGVAKPQRNPWYNQKPEYIGLPVATNEQISPPYRENGISPFSTSNSQTYYIRNKTGPQRKESLTLAHSQEFTDYDYTSRTLQPLHNITDSEEKEDADVDYEYDEDFGTSPILRKFNQDGYLRPEHMIGTVLKTIDNKTELTNRNSTVTDANKQTLDDNYVLPVLNSTKELPVDLPKPLNTNFSTEFSDSVGKHLNNDIFAEDIEDEQNLGPDTTVTLQEPKPKRNRNNNRNHEKIAFAPINVLTKPERPDNWVIYETPKEEPLLPQIPELTMDPLPSAEVPKPIKENSWLDLTNLKRKFALQFMESSGQFKKEQVNLDKKTLYPIETVLTKSDSTATKTTNLNTEPLTDST